MAIVNGYATLADFTAMLNPSGSFPAYSGSAADNGFIEDLITDSSRLIDQVTNRTFFMTGGSSGSAAVTQYYDTPTERLSGETRPNLWLVDDCLYISSVTNGDGTVIPSTEYVTQPYNSIHKTNIALRGSSSYYWQRDTAGDLERAIQVAGGWGYVDRAATDPLSLEIVENTRRACLIIAASLYRKRTGVSLEGIAQVTAAGVVVTPGGIPKDAWELIKNYSRVTAF